MGNPHLSRNAVLIYMSLVMSLRRLVVLLCVLQKVVEGAFGGVLVTASRGGIELRAMDQLGISFYKVVCSC